MTSIRQLGRKAWRKWSVDGVSSSGANKPTTDDIFPFVDATSSAIDAITQASGASVAKADKPSLDATASSHSQGDIGIVYAGLDRGVYKLVNGSWLFLQALPEDAAQAYADAAASDSALAQTAAAAAVPAAAAAAASAAIAASYASVTAFSQVFKTKSEANAGLSAVAPNAYVLVLTDETQGDVQTAYQKISGAYVLAAKQGRKEVRPEDFGALGDGTTNDRSALLAAASWITSNGGRLRLTGGKSYYAGTANPPLDLTAITIDAEPGAVFSGNVSMKAGFSFQRTMDINRTDTDYVYRPLRTTSKHQRSITDKEVFLDGMQADRASHVAIDCNNLLHQQLLRSSGLAWATISPDAVAAESVTYALPTGYFRGGFTFAKGGDELSCRISTGEFTRAAIIRTTEGTYEFFAPGMGGAGQVWFEPFGGSPSKISDIDWAGRADHQNWYPGNANWKITLHSLKQFSISLNGRILFGPFSIAAGLITHMGFAGDSNPTIQATFSDWVLTRGADVTGRGLLDIYIDGDSKTAPYHGDWPSFCRELLEHSFGANVLKMDNAAVDGSTTASTLARVTAHGFSGVSDFVLAVGVNNAQNAISIATTKSDVAAIIDLAQAANCRVTVVLPQDIYTRANADNFGVTIFNEALVPFYREAIHRVAASRGCKIVDLSTILKPSLAYEAKTSPSDPRFIGQYLTGLRDNIHNGMLQYRKIGWAVARAIMGWWPVNRRGFDEMDIPASFMTLAAAGYTSGTNKARIFHSDEGAVALSGELAGGTRTDSTNMMKIPDNLRANGQRVFLGLTGNGTKIRLQLTAGGNFKIFDCGADTSNILLDGCRWQVS